MNGESMKFFVVFLFQIKLYYFFLNPEPPRARHSLTHTHTTHTRASCFYFNNNEKPKKNHSFLLKTNDDKHYTELTKAIYFSALKKLHQQQRKLNNE